MTRNRIGVDLSKGVLDVCDPRRGEARVANQPAAIARWIAGLGAEDANPDALLRTVQRRVKIWRTEIAKELVFGTNHSARGLMPPDARGFRIVQRVKGHQAAGADPASPNGIRQEHLAEATT